jgi:hypothetical protein
VPPGQEGRYRGGDHRYYPVAGPNTSVQQPHSPIVVRHNPQPKRHPIVFPKNRKPATTTASNQSH